MVGFDKKTGELSLKYFNEFAIYGDTLPYILSGFQYGDYAANKKYDPGKLYHAKNYPYFQIYEKNGSTPLIYGKAEAPVVPTNWGKLNVPNKNDSVVYSWFNLKVAGDSAVILSGYTYDGLSDTSAIVRLDSAASWARDERDTRGYDSHGLDTTSLSVDSIAPWSSEAPRVYLKKEANGQLSFTVKVGNDKKQGFGQTGLLRLLNIKVMERTPRLCRNFITEIQR
ncbi:MAG: hypothetical protein LBB73_01405 [Dysgonamonadaceae bacterium]|nr:hypothetical protein [Dysgonamonadaceae bacterium]